ncbi:hypothetical protein [Sulfurimonas microaerophilic]|uniref:hypothetical protein n=1 Tax=Sulfurimonas microaerophilic TaxID=3058392 RepID=UPI0027149F8A|nr:hypothetical protein [Sulfurimonas sp. hsl 1-7]
MTNKLRTLFVIHGESIEEDIYSEDFEIETYSRCLKYIRENLLKSSLFKNINIQIFVVEDNDINAHSRKLDDSEYVILLNRGLIQFAMETCGWDIDFLEEELQYLGDKNDIMAFWILFTIYYFGGHEYGHIIDGHLEFSYNATIDEKSPITFFSMCELPSGLKDKPDVFRHLLELNADRYSSVFLAKSLWDLLLKFVIDKKKDELQTFESLIKLIVYIIYLTHYKFGFFDIKTKDYPTHFFRAYSILNDFPRVMNSIIKEEYQHNVEKTVFNAMYTVFDYLADHDEDFMSEINRDDIHSYNAEMSALYTKEQKLLNDFLKEYSLIKV